MSNLITLEDVKSFSGINSTNQDAQITDLIPKASAMVRNYCNRNFIDYFSTPKVEVFNGGVNKFLLEELPVVAIANVEYSSDFGQTYNTMVEYTDYTFNVFDETIDVLYLSCFPKAVNGYKISYYGGYETCPADLKQATIDIVLYYMKSDMSVKSTRSPGSSATQVEYIVNATLPSHIRRVLDSYRLDL
jgi:hypothetical protein